MSGPAGSHEVAVTQHELHLETKVRKAPPEVFSDLRLARWTGRRVARPEVMRHVPVSEDLVRDVENRRTSALSPSTLISTSRLSAPVIR
ncbi:MAG: hypothetical protein M3406_09455, partial [Chloroflexota bacterium]|nr:hypothetical protein [Chloroflexota bacterium]